MDNQIRQKRAPHISTTENLQHKHKAAENVKDTNSISSICSVCGFKNNHGVLTKDGFICERDFQNPYLFLSARKLSAFALGKIPLDRMTNQFQKGDQKYREAVALSKRTKNRLKIDENVFIGTQKQLEVII